MFFRKTLKGAAPENITKNRRLLLANERTFLAWMRTAIGIMAFGFVIQKFENPILKTNSSLKCHCIFYAGLFLVLLGVIVAMLATYRFIRVQKDIVEDVFRPSFIPDIMIAILLGSIGLLMVIYLFTSGYG